MFKQMKVALWLTALLVLAALAACQPQTQVVEVTRVVTETITEEGQEVEVTRVVTEMQEVVVTSTPEAMAPMGAADPTTWREVSFGEPDSLDPALGYETSGGNVIQNVMEPLIIYDHVSPTDFVPALAVEVPSLDNGGISEDGRTYTFQIREGVTFHAGGTLEPHDVAYSFQRGLLQSDPNSPQWLLMEPIMGFATGDITAVSYTHLDVYKRQVCGDLSVVSKREWLVTNGIGGYASGTLANVLSRRYHGLLMAALEPPLGRTLLLAKLDETAEYDGIYPDSGRLTPLYLNRWEDGTVEGNGHHHLNRFHLEGTTPVWTCLLYTSRCV